MTVLDYLSPLTLSLPSTPKRKRGKDFTLKATAFVKSSFAKSPRPLLKKNMKIPPVLKK